MPRTAVDDLGGRIWIVPADEFAVADGRTIIIEALAEQDLTIVVG